MIDLKNKIEVNGSTLGFCVDFSINGKKYYTDVSYNMLGCPECMIFKYNDDGEIDWSGVYTDRDVTVSKESLLECIKEFAEGLQDD